MNQISKTMSWLLGAGVVVGACCHAQAQTTNRVRLSVVRDTRVSSATGETEQSAGGDNALKLKSYQEMSLIDFDPTSVAGYVIEQAEVHVHVTGSEILRRVTVSSISAPWFEGKSGRMTSEVGASTFAMRRHPDVAWAYPGSDLTAVILGVGGTVWSTADAAPPDQAGWQVIAVKPAVVAARVARISYGLVLFDDTGTELIRHGDAVTIRSFPNRYVHSREQRNFAPYLTVRIGARDATPPAAPVSVRASAGGLPAGELYLQWNVPQDQGPAGTIGFIVTVNGKRLPQYLVPAATRAGARVHAHLRGLDGAAGNGLQVEIRAVDGAGNVGPAAIGRVTASAYQPEPLPGQAEPLTIGKVPAALPKLGGAEVSILDPLDKVNPVTGDMTPSQPAGYAAKNHLWDAATKTIRLYAAKNEVVAFQIHLRGQATQLQPALLLDDSAALPYTIGHIRCVPAKNGPLPDPVVPLQQPLDVPLKDRSGARLRGTSLLCELYVPHEAHAGVRRGKLVLRSREATLELAVELTIWDFTLPDYLSFLPEMNCYGLPANELDYYRLAHVHRTVLNRLPYSQRGTIAEGCAPRWDGKRLDWEAWDRRFGPYLDGSAFQGLPREGVPLECFYLPLHENWPLPIDPNYSGDRWADRAFTDTYRRTQVAVTKEIARHLSERGWHDTIFQIYLNNKSSFKKRGWSRGSSPWILDEPAHFQDFWALRWFGGLYHQGLADSDPKLNILFRCDLSRPQWQRDLLDDVLDYSVTGRALRRYRQLVMDRKQELGNIVLEYGSTNAIEDSNVQPAAWCVDVWTLGGDGVVPWQTVGTDNSWRAADTLSLFYRGGPIGAQHPVPSVRLKAYRRGEQDVEYYTLLAKLTKQPRWAIAQRIRSALELAGKWESTGFTGGEDAGRIDYGKLKPQDLWALRMRVARVLSAAHPAAQRRLVSWHVPRRELVPMLPRIAPSTPPVARDANSRSGHSPAGQVAVVQGHALVRDAVLDPIQPEKPLGAVPRDNRIRRGAVVNPMLIRFDLRKFAPLHSSKLQQAKLSLFVWDPASKARVRVGVFPVRQQWDERSATWSRAGGGLLWRGSRSFNPGLHLGKVVDQVIVEPNTERDIVEPPVEYQWDITSLARQWLDGKPNYGIAVLPIADRRIDDGNNVRFQVLASEYRDARVTPKLTLSYAR